MSRLHIDGADKLRMYSLAVGKGQQEGLFQSIGQGEPDKCCFHTSRRIKTSCGVSKANRRKTDAFFASRADREVTRKGAGHWPLQFGKQCTYDIPPHLGSCS